MKTALIVSLMWFALLLGPSLATAIDLNCEGAPVLSASEASGVASKLQAQYGSLRTLQASFDQTSFIAALGDSESSRGEVWYGRPGQMKWHYKTPEEQVFLLRDEALYFYQASERQLLVEQVTQSSLSELPVSFLLGVGEIDKSFEILGGCRTPNGSLLRLVPKEGRDANLKELWLLTDHATSLPMGAKTVDLGGNSTSIVFSHLRRDVALADTVFRPDFPAGIDVQDRRPVAEHDIGRAAH